MALSLGLVNINKMIIFGILSVIIHHYTVQSGPAGLVPLKNWRSRICLPKLASVSRTSVKCSVPHAPMNNHQQGQKIVEEENSSPKPSFESQPKLENGVKVNPGEGDLVDLGPIYSLKSVMEILTNEEHRNTPGVRTLLDNYVINCQELKKVPPLTQFRKPFIVIEGFQRRRRYIMTRKLSRYMRGIEVYNPPPGYLDLREAFNYSVAARRAYFALGVYIAANNVKMAIPYKAAVMSGYWMDQATFALAKKYKPNLPPDNSHEWFWPHDLLKPDIIFYLMPTPDSANTTLKPDQLKPLILNIYRRWREPPIIFIEKQVTYRGMVNEMIPYLNSMYHRPSNY